jgi:hypothetical protein
MDDPSALVRLAAFKFLEEQVNLAGDDKVLSRSVLVAGFACEGQRVPLMGPQGIFKRHLNPMKSKSAVVTRRDCFANAFTKASLGNVSFAPIRVIALFVVFGAMSY